MVPSNLATMYIKEEHGLSDFTMYPFSNSSLIYCLRRVLSASDRVISLPQGGVDPGFRLIWISKDLWEVALYTSPH